MLSFKSLPKTTLLTEFELKLIKIPKMLSKIIKLNANCGQIYQTSYRLMAATTQTPSDPIQKLFVDKIREYTQKSKSTTGGLVDASPQVLKGLQEEMDRVTRSYGLKDEKTVGTLDLKFEAETKLDPINMTKD